VKQIMMLMIAGLILAGCCSTRNDIQRVSTSDLQLRRYELKHCLSMARTSWDKQVAHSSVYNDVEENLEEKQVIEGEITRRGVTDYRWTPSGGYQRSDRHCNCQCWVVTL
jgi:hypothetical protein